MRRVMVIGGSGSGKSTLAQEVGRHLQTGATEIDGFLARSGQADCVCGRVRAV